MYDLFINAGKIEEKNLPSPTLQQANSDTLSAAEQIIVSELQQQDRKVHLREQAQLLAIGGFTPSANQFTMQTGPDGKRYAVASNVEIAVSPALNAEDTVTKARHIRAAVLASASPSAADLRIADRAHTMELDATTEVTEQNIIKQKQLNQYLSAAQDQPNNSLMIEA